jgi:hypothetical protein
MLKRLESNCQQMAAAAEYYDVNTFLSSPQTNLNEVMLEMAPMLFANDLPAPANPKEAVRIPQLPCVKQGILEGFTAVRSLAIPFLSDPRSAVQKVQSGWQHHPEALVPALAGMLLDRRQPREGAKSIPLLSMQASLFQMAAQIAPAGPLLGGQKPIRTCAQPATRFGGRTARMFAECPAGVCRRRLFGGRVGCLLRFRIPARELRACSRLAREMGKPPARKPDPPPQTH